MSENKLTPMMQQFYEIKAKYPDFILFFRLGDFYEMFDEDAEITAGILDIALTRRSNQKMCGIPYHALDNYLYKMIKAGKKVAICEQVEEPGKNKIVKRDVVELVTPGTFTDAKHLNRNRDSFLVSLVVENGKSGIAACDASTGKFWVFREKAEPEKIGSFLKILQPSEIIIPRHYPELEEAVKQYYHTLVPEYYFSPPVNEVLLLEHFQVGTLKGLGLGEEVLAGSAGAVLRYLKDNLFQDVKHLTEIRHIHSEDFVYLPESTLRNLEILEPLFQNTVDTSLFTNQNATMTAMGAREFRNWLVHPLRNREKILKRQEQVQFFKEKPLVLKDIRSILKQIPDVERMLSRISLKRRFPSRKD
jgi:DNA mismatch repair protein MutS